MEEKISYGNKYERVRAKLQQQTNQGMALDESSHHHRVIPSGILPTGWIISDQTGGRNSLKLSGKMCRFSSPK